MVFWSPSLAFANNTGAPFHTYDIMPTILQLMDIPLTAPLDGHGQADRLTHLVGDGATAHTRAGGEQPPALVIDVHRVECLGTLGTFGLRCSAGHPTTVRGGGTT